MTSFIAQLIIWLDSLSTNPFSVNKTYKRKLNDWQRYKRKSDLELYEVFLGR